MKCIALTRRFFSCFLLVMLAGCATAPTQEMSDARQSVKAARDAAADKHAPGLYNAAEEMLSQAEKDLSVHSYKRARKNAVSSKKTAINARNVAQIIGHAKDTMAEAKELNALSTETSGALERAEGAVRAGDDTLAIRLAEEVDRLATRDVLRGKAAQIEAEKEQERRRANQIELDKAKQLINDIRKYQHRLNDGQLAELGAVEFAYRKGEGAKSHDLASRLHQDLVSKSVLPKPDRN